MTVKKLNDDYVALYSLGIEKEYLGNEIIYDDNSIVFMFFYYKFLTRVYVITGREKIENLVQVKEKCKVITYFDNKEARRIREFLESRKNKDLIFYFPELFFLDLRFCINKKKWYLECEYLFHKYEEKLKYGINNFNI